MRVNERLRIDVIVVNLLCLNGLSLPRGGATANVHDDVT